MSSMMFMNRWLPTIASLLVTVSLTGYALGEDAADPGPWPPTTLPGNVYLIAKA